MSKLTVKFSCLTLYEDNKQAREKPGVALQTPRSLIHSFIHWLILYYAPRPAEGRAPPKAVNGRGLPQDLHILGPEKKL